jgi:predicted dinucleotide-binding enzyme
MSSHTICVVAMQAMLGEGVSVVSAFQNVSAHKLKDLDAAIDCDVLVTGDDKDARADALTARASPRCSARSGCAPP